MIKHRQGWHYKAFTLFLAFAMLVCAPFSTVNAYATDVGQSAETFDEMDTTFQEEETTDEETETKGEPDSGPLPEKPAAPMNVLLDDGGAPDGTWEVSDATSLENALKDFMDGDTVRLMQDINYDKGIVIDGKTITFDVGEYTLNVKTATGYALEAKNSGQVHLNGNGAFNVEGEGGVRALGGSKATVTNAKATGQHGRGAYADGAGTEITILGNVESTGGSGYGVQAWSGAIITVDGTITAANVYLAVDVKGLSKGAGEPDPEKIGYLKYSWEDIASVIWVKADSSVDEYFFEINGNQYETLELALANVEDGDSIKLLKPYTHKAPVEIVDKSFTFNLNGKNLNIKADNATALKVEGASLSITGDGELNVEGGKCGVWVGRGGLVTVTNAVALDTVADDDSNGIGVYAEHGAQVEILGDVEAKIGAWAKHDGTKITIRGEISQGPDVTEYDEEYYVVVGYDPKHKSWGAFKHTEGHTDTGYLVYTDAFGEPMVLVKADSSVPERNCAIRDYRDKGYDLLYSELDAALATAVEEGQIRIELLKNIHYTKTLNTWGCRWIFVLNNCTLNVETTEDAGLDTNRSVEIIGPGAFNVTGAKYGVNAGNSSTYVTVTSAAATNEDGIGISSWSGAHITVQQDVRGGACGIKLGVGDNEVKVGGNVFVNPASGVGVEVDGSGMNTVTVEGSILVNPDRYVKLGETYVSESEGKINHGNAEKEGYLLYTTETYPNFNLWVGNGVKPSVTSVVVTPDSIALNKGDAYTFTAVVSGTNNPSQSVNWTVEGGVAGTTITDGVLNIAPDETASTLIVRATSVIDSTKSGTATVTVTQTKPSYTVTFNLNGGIRTGGGELTQIIASGGSATAPTVTRSNYTFIGWDKDFTNITSDLTVTAIWRYNGSDSTRGGSGGGSYSVESMTIPITILPEKEPGQPVTAAASIEATEGKDLSASVLNSHKAITSAITKAKAHAKKENKTENGISVELDINKPKDAKSLTITLSQSSLNSLIKEGVKSLKINCYPVKISFDKKTLTEIQKQSDSDVTITIKQVQNLSASAKKITGTRPVYDITVSHVKDGKPIVISDLNGGIATISIFYKADKNEAVGYLYGIYVDAKGNVARIDSSVFDTNENLILISTGHLLTVYGVGYTVPSAKFTDIGTHWAKESIDYAVGRGLFRGTSDTRFSPDMEMNRGMLITVLGRLAGADVSVYTTSSFSDVAVGAYYQPYIEWAYKNGIVSGIGNGMFAPERAVTREEIALILQNYAKATGYNLPVIREAITFADNDVIGSYFRDAVRAMQQAGIIVGGTDNKFNPKGSATRAQVAAMLHRYIKLTIDPATAQGWVKNDFGQYMFFKEGKKLTGEQTIGGKKYFFDSNGMLRTGWLNVDGNWRYYHGNKMVTGWCNIGSEAMMKSYYFDANGNLTAGKWLELNGKWYYFNADGSLAKDTVVDGYEVGPDGARKTKQ